MCRFCFNYLFAQAFSIAKQNKKIMLKGSTDSEITSCSASLIFIYKLIIRQFINHSLIIQLKFPLYVTYKIHESVNEAYCSLPVRHWVHRSPSSCNMSKQYFRWCPIHLLSNGRPKRNPSQGCAK